MNNDELKKKIFEILFPVLKGSRISCNEENACKQCWFPCEVDRLADSLADALISAGIGNVKEAEHCAEVAERALIDCVEYYSYSALCPVLDCNYNKACWRKECTSDIVKCFKIQAKKELAENGKNEQD